MYTVANKIIVVVVLYHVIMLDISRIGVVMVFPLLPQVGKFMTVDREADEVNSTETTLVSQPCQIYVTQSEIPVSSC